MGNVARRRAGVLARLDLLQPGRQRLALALQPSHLGRLGAVLLAAPDGLVALLEGAELLAQRLEVGIHEAGDLRRQLASAGEEGGVGRLLLVARGAERLEAGLQLTDLPIAVLKSLLGGGGLAAQRLELLPLGRVLQPRVLGGLDRGEEVRRAQLGLGEVGRGHGHLGEGALVLLQVPVEARAGLEGGGVLGLRGREVDVQPHETEERGPLSRRLHLGEGLRVEGERADEGVQKRLRRGLHLLAVRPDVQVARAVPRVSPADLDLDRVALAQVEDDLPVIGALAQRHADGLLEGVRVERELDGVEGRGLALVVHPADHDDGLVLGRGDVDGLDLLDVLGEQSEDLHRARSPDAGQTGPVRRTPRRRLAPGPHGQDPWGRVLAGARGNANRGWCCGPSGVNEPGPAGYLKRREDGASAGGPSG